MSAGVGVVPGPPTAAVSRPPGWLILATGVLAVTVLVLAVAETDLRAHYLIDEGEYVSLFGLAFILMAGIVLYRHGRLFGSLPLVVPWLLYPVITQGDQLIDNLSINPMRIIVHVLLAMIFATPVAVAALAARALLTPKPGQPPRVRWWTAFFPGLRALAEGRLGEGTTLFVAALLTLEIWLADQYLGTLMIVTLIGMIVGVLLYGSLPGRGSDESLAWQSRERTALVALLAGVAISFGLYEGYKNAPGAYQGSPSFFLDPAQQDARYRLDRVVVPAKPPAVPSSPDTIREALTAYARTLEQLLAGYHILDRNYTYDYHNELFLRHTPLLPNYRAAAFELVSRSESLRADADARGRAARAVLADDDPLAALLDDVRSYTAFAFERVPVLARMSASFEQTQAGLQHAAHLYEGESKYLGQTLQEIVTKHHAAVEAPGLAPVTGELATISRSMFESYAHHVVGF